MQNNNFVPKGGVYMGNFTCYCVVVFVGKNTKQQLNLSKPRIKGNQFKLLIKRMSITILISLAFIFIFLLFMFFFFYNNTQDIIYFNETKNSSFLKIFGLYFLYLSNGLPIALIVSL